ncbi:MAG: hypothetical protein MI700_04140 [Balneolales bacterium]|nr:hypothetical protein [Balneolales bacterium]
MDENFPEITALQVLVTTFQMSVKAVAGEFLCEKEYFPKIRLTIRGREFSFYVDDEYNDLTIPNPALSVCVALRSLEDYEYAEDYFVWCAQHNFDTGSTAVRSHFQHLGEVYSQVHKILGEVDSKISDYDFELDAGAARKLRKFIS